MGKEIGMDCEVIESVSSKIRELLCGLGQDVQSAIVADMLSILLCGFQGPGKEDARKQLLAMVLELVETLTPVNDAIISEYLEKKGLAIEEVEGYLRKLKH